MAITKQQQDFIRLMREAGVLRFGEFITKSGRKTPYFVNTGNYRSGRQLAALGGFYADAVYSLLGADFTALFGPAYKGIPLVSACAVSLFTAHGLDKPYCFNRKEAKDHGEGGSLIGYAPKDGDELVIIEDVITAGTALRESMALLGSLGDLTVRHMFVSVDRCERGNIPGKTAAQEAAEEFGVAVHPIVTVRDIRSALAQDGEDPALLAAMDAYMEEYCVFSD